MALGTLQIITTTASQALPLAGVTCVVTITATNETIELTSDANGFVNILDIEAPERALSLDVNYEGVPYSTVNLVAAKEGYQKTIVSGIQIFAEEQSLMQVDMAPIANVSLVKETDIGRSILITPVQRACSETAQSNIDNLAAPIVLDYPIIPKTVTVHLGRPTATARDVTVTFKDYIKNVASSEIYPTWPVESLKANILAQISLILNRVYTEWYRSQGYNFDITNSTAYDQYFVEGRDIFSSVSEVVDEIFNEYIRKVNTVNPYYAEYCDGKIAQCSGMKQWETVTLAEQGRNAFEILTYFYGDDIEIVTTDRIEGVSGTYPGFVLKNGVSSDAVATIQNQLNRIAVNYPSFPKIYPVDGIFGPKTETTVKAFQKQFSLVVDGLVGMATWYKISYIYVAVKKLAQLTSEGVDDRLDFEYPGESIREGERSIYVQEIQFFLQKISLFTSSVPSVEIDSSFGSGTRAAVIAFQRLAGLTVDGIVGVQTWNTLVKAYQDTLEVDVPTVSYMPEYPGTSLRVGSTGENVRIIQNALNVVSQAVGNLSLIQVDGIFGSGTESAVRYYQSNNDLDADGIVGRLTWNSIRSQYTSIRSNPFAYNPMFYELAQVLYNNYTSLIYNIDNDEKNL